uniref:WAP domain-containing protein n=1 Tax=Pseudonaja textilis TaxID=8673 RepID=A0A670ZLQ9_PSETE
MDIVFCLFSLLIWKPGVCPKSPPDIVTPCIAKCENDWKCPKNQKCCTYGCMTTCRGPCMDPI